MKFPTVGVWIMFNPYWKVGSEKTENGKGRNLYLGWLRGGWMYFPAN